MSDFKERMEKLNEMIKNSNHIVFFGGAGVSTESGIPDFRSKDGLYNQHDVQFDAYSPEYLLSHDCVYDNSKVFFEFYRQKMDTRHIEPNITHYKLAEMEAKGKLDCIVTQNIDGLHQKAGSKVVYEIHGTTQSNYCTRCGKVVSSDYIFESTDPIPACPECGSMIRPDVTMYGESLPDAAWNGAAYTINKADLFIIGGTSLTVYPAANLIHYFKGKNIVIINRDKTPQDQYCNLVFHENLGEVFKNIILE